MADLDPALDRLPREDLRHCTRHVVTENERVLRTVDLLRGAALAEIGPLLTASHESLRDDYRVCIIELDAAVETLLAHGALGARMTGGGFGGSVIALIAEDRHVGPTVALGDLHNAFDGLDDWAAGELLHLARCPARAWCETGDGQRADTATVSLPLVSLMPVGWPS